MSNITALKTKPHKLFSSKQMVKLSSQNQTETYMLSFNKIPYGVLTYNTATKTFGLRLNKDTPLSIRPATIYGSLVLDNSLKPRDYSPKSEDIYRWICNRVVPQYRQNITGILSSNRLTHYDPWELAKSNRGKSINDRWEILRVKFPSAYNA